MDFLRYVVPCHFEWCGRPAETMVETVWNPCIAFPQWREIARTPACTEHAADVTWSNRIIYRP